MYSDGIDVTITHAPGPGIRGTRRVDVCGTSGCPVGMNGMVGAARRAKATRPRAATAGVGAGTGRAHSGERGAVLTQTPGGGTVNESHNHTSATDMLHRTYSWSLRLQWGQLSFNQRILVFEVALLLLSVTQLGVQAFTVYRYNWWRQDPDLFMLAAVGLSRHLFRQVIALHLSHFQQQLQQHGKRQVPTVAQLRNQLLFAYPWLSLSSMVVIYLTIQSAWKLARQRPGAILLLSPLPVVTFVLSRHAPALDVLRLQGPSLSAKHALKWLLRREIWRVVVDATYVAGLLPLLANRHPYLHYDRLRCGVHVLVFALQTFVLVGTQAAVVLREKLHLEYERDRSAATKIHSAASANGASKGRPAQSHSKMGLGLTWEEWLYKPMRMEQEEGMEGSKVLMGLQSVQIALLSALLVLVVKVRQWGSYGVLLLMGLAGLRLVHLSEEHPSVVAPTQ